MESLMSQRIPEIVPHPFGPKYRVKFVPYASFWWYRVTHLPSGDYAENFDPAGALCALDGARGTKAYERWLTKSKWKP